MNFSFSCLVSLDRYLDRGFFYRLEIQQLNVNIYNKSFASMEAAPNLKLKLTVN